MSQYNTSSNEQLYNLIMDPEFFYLTPKPSPESYGSLEEHIVYHGCPAPIQVWNNIILFDYVQYDICKKWEIPFQIKQLSFSSRNEALLYTTYYLVKNTDLPDLYFRYNIGKMYQATKPIIHTLYNRALPITLPPITMLKDAKGSPSAVLIGLLNNISHRTVTKYASYSAAIDRIMKKSPAVAKDIFHGDLTLSIDNTISLSLMSANEIQVLCNHAKLKNDASLLHSELLKNNQKKQKDLPETIKYTPASKQHRKINTDPAIKQMPKYDPDAELSSLSLTIPTWISSMNRASMNTDYSFASEEAMNKVMERLRELIKAGRKIEKIIKENTNARKRE